MSSPSPVVIPIDGAVDPEWERHLRTTPGLVDARPEVAKVRHPAGRQRP